MYIRDIKNDCLVIAFCSFWLVLICLLWVS